MKQLKRISANAIDVWTSYQKPISAALKYGFHPEGMSIFKSEEGALGTHIVSSRTLLRCPEGLTYPCEALVVLENGVEKATGSSLAIGHEYFSVKEWYEPGVSFRGQKLKAVDPFIDLIPGHLLVAIEPERDYSLSPKPGFVCIDIKEL